MKIENSREIRGLGPSFTKLPLCLKHPKTCETWPLDGHYTWVSLILCKMISWRLGIAFCIFLPMILGIRVLFGPSFPKVPWCPKYPKTGETLPSNEFSTQVRLQLLWIVEFNTFDEFLYIQAHDMGYLGPITGTCSCAQNILKLI